MESTKQKPKSVCYFPSLSAGAYRSPISKDAEVAPGVPYRFWDDRVPEPWRHKYFLITAGHLYKHANVRAEWGLQDSLVFGDSGGFQIATGALKWDLALRDTIFDWLETNSDIACNIDIPPRITYEGRFLESLQMSKDNFKYFESKQSGKTKFLNVIQGESPAQFNTWYNEVRDFEFPGWCFGSSRNLVNFMYILALMLKEREFEKPRNEWIHLLGISKVSDFLVLWKLQHLLNKYYDNRITVSTDSSSPGQYPIFGQMVWNANWKDLVFNMYYFPSDGSVVYPTEGTLPSIIDHPGVPYMTWDMIRNYSTEAVTRLTHHNLYAYIQVCDQAGKLSGYPYECIDSILPNDMIQVLKSMEEMFISEDPIVVYEQYKQFYLKFGGENVPKVEKQTASEFFDFSSFDQSVVEEKEARKAAKLQNLRERKAAKKIV